jgi:hypothetical protein
MWGDDEVGAGRILLAPFCPIALNPRAKPRIHINFLINLSFFELFIERELRKNY